jgi:hypothetical protein
VTSAGYLYVLGRWSNKLGFPSPIDIKRYSIAGKGPRFVNTTTVSSEKLILAL